MTDGQGAGLRELGEVEVCSQEKRNDFDRRIAARVKGEGLRW